MERLALKKQNQARRAKRVRKLAVGSSTRPRLSVHISNTHVSAQIIDDSKSRTLAYATTVGQKEAASLNMTAKSEWVGRQIAAKAKKAKVSRVVFDRGARAYHGRVKALADSARQEGLEF